MGRRKGQVVTDMIEKVEESASTVAEATGGTTGVVRPLRLEDMAAELVERARAERVALVGPGGLLSGLTKTVLEAALDGELTEHLGYEPYDPAGHNSGNSRNGFRTKTVITDIGPITLDVPRDRAGSFEPRIVGKRQRRL